PHRHLGRCVHVFEDSDDADHRRGVDALAEGLIVEADIAARDGYLHLFAGLGDYSDDLRELPHDVGLLRIAKIQAVGGSYWCCAHACNIASGFGDGVHCAQTRIEIAPPGISVERHRPPTLAAFDANDATICGTRASDAIGLYHVIVLLPDPAL